VAPNSVAVLRQLQRQTTGEVVVFWVGMADEQHVSAHRSPPDRNMQLRPQSKEIGHDDFCSCEEQRARTVIKRANVLAGCEKIERQCFGLAAGCSVGDQNLVRDRGSEAIALSGEFCGDALVILPK